VIRFTPTKSEIRFSQNQNRETVYYMAIHGITPDLAGPPIVAIMPFPTEADAINTRKALGFVEGQDLSLIGLAMNGLIVDQKSDENRTMIKIVDIRPLEPVEMVNYRRDYHFSEMLRRFENLYVNKDYSAARNELMDYATSIGMSIHINGRVDMKMDNQIEQTAATTAVETKTESAPEAVEQATEVKADAAETSTDASASETSKVDQPEAVAEATQEANPQENVQPEADNKSEVAAEQAKNVTETVKQTAPPKPVSAPKPVPEKAPVRTFGGRMGGGMNRMGHAANPAATAPAAQANKPATAETKPEETKAAEPPKPVAAPVVGFRMGRRAGFGMAARMANAEHADNGSDPSPGS